VFIRTLQEQLDLLLAGVPEHGLCVALSGGVDSIVLLTALQQLVRTGPKIWRARLLRAVHVHHHLQLRADDWAREVRRICKKLGVPLTVKHVKVAIYRGSSLEAEARLVRYASLSKVLRPQEVLLTAHHRDDQFETIFLQLMRGAGVNGLAAMPAITPFAAGWLARPMLECSRVEIKQWAKHQGLFWIEDSSNSDLRFDRNYLRAKVLPSLLARWPSAPRVASRSAFHLAQAREILEERAVEDLLAITSADVLNLVPLGRLSVVRQRNVLRAWVRGCGASVPDTVHLERIRVELPEARVDARPVVRWSGGEVRRYRGKLFCLPSGIPVLDLEREWLWSWRRSGSLDLCRAAGPGAGVLHMVNDPEGPLLGTLLPGKLCVRFRRGGERLALQIQGPQQILKEILRVRGVLPWRRDAIPLLCLPDNASDLVAVAGLCVAAPYQAYASQGDPPVKTQRLRRYRLVWEDAPAVFA